MLVKGYVESVTETPSKFTFPNGKRKPSFWRVKVDNIMYGFGNSQPMCKEGDYVAFDAEQKGEYWSADAATLKPVKPDPEASAPPANAAAAPAKTGWRPDEERETRAERLHRQDIITYQASRKDAIEMVNLLMANGLIDFGKAKGAQKQSIVDIIVDMYTTRFCAETAALAPTAKESPIEASYGSEVDSLRKPAGRPRKAVQEQPEVAQKLEQDEEDRLPWG